MRPRPRVTITISGLPSTVPTGGIMLIFKLVRESGPRQINNRLLVSDPTLANCRVGMPDSVQRRLAGQCSRKSSVNLA